MAPNLNGKCEENKDIYYLPHILDTECGTSFRKAFGRQWLFPIVTNQFWILKHFQFHVNIQTEEREERQY